MKTIKCMFGLLTAFLLLFNVTLVTSASAETRVSFGVTEPVVSYNPYGDSVALMYGVWCEVIGCLGTYDFRQGKYVGKLAERWEVDKRTPAAGFFTYAKTTNEVTAASSLPMTSFIRSTASRPIRKASRAALCGKLPRSRRSTGLRYGLRRKSRSRL